MSVFLGDLRIHTALHELGCLSKKCLMLSCTNTNRCILPLTAIEDYIHTHLDNERYLSYYLCVLIILTEFNST